MMILHKHNAFLGIQDIPIRSFDISRNGPSVVIDYTRARCRVRRGDDWEQTGEFVFYTVTDDNGRTVFDSRDTDPVDMAAFGRIAAIVNTTPPFAWERRYANKTAA